MGSRIKCPNPRIVSDLLCPFDMLRSVGPDGIHPRLLRKLSEVLTKPL